MSVVRPLIRSCIIALVLARIVSAQQPSFLNILPPGENGLVNSTDAARYEGAGTLPPHFADQLGMYGDLVYAPPGLTETDLLTFFKDASFGVAAANVERTETPRAGLTIRRDQFGVAHVTALARSDVMLGAGYVTGEDRLFLADVLRHVGRGRMSEFLGPSQGNIDMDQSLYRVAGYSEAELQAQIDALPKKFGALGQQVVDDFTDFLAGLNQYITDALADSSKMPAEYPALQLTPQPWVPTDIVAVATLIQATFAAGGGRDQSGEGMDHVMEQQTGARMARG